MELPNADQAKVDRDKITEYLLCSTHPDGGGKAKFFTRFGFRLESWDVFAQALREHGARHPVVKKVESAYGIRYTIDGEIETPDGRNPRVRTVWLTEGKTTIPRLITAHPIKEAV